ncbi:DUF397 domain-containing protein [Saccharopolyspora phatthalungensis]|uniref:DUF397 domain-containing protein n=1 Tax=Saccharopolyspora phatthalungensis TaxID=664693 RepID=A0A840PZQ7_9PSEU|nr:DUF397 domain-containing protein [Saccharopolyspora phatthalungensis]MBB5153237.1 hypothetical protein [Saccharopolyspora phatthalungensis]
MFRVHRSVQQHSSFLRAVFLTAWVASLRAVRDSKDPAGAPLMFEPPAFTTFLNAVKAKRFDCIA